jgi:hypothetical protein
MNLVAAKAQLDVSRQCITKMLDGAADIPDDLRNLPNPFLFPQQADELCQEHDPDAPPALMEGRQVFDWLPDLADNQVGMPRKVNDFQMCTLTLALRMCGVSPLCCHTRIVLVPKHSNSFAGASKHCSSNVMRMRHARV